MSWMTKMLWGRSAQPRPRSWEDWLAMARSGDGFAREAAVEALCMSGHGPALPVLLERVNDWVPQVRLAARKAVEAFLVDEHLASWAEALASLVALRRGARADHSQLLARVDAFLGQPASLQLLKSLRATMPLVASRYVFTLELQQAVGEPARVAVLAQALSSGDVGAATQALNAVQTVRSTSAQLELAMVACRSGFAPVRAAGLRRVLASPSSEAKSQALAMCWDRSAVVRALAVAGVVQGRENLIEDARTTLRTSATAWARDAALDLLCLLMPAEALALCRLAAGDPSVMVRCSAYARQFALLQGEERDALACAALWDASPKLRYMACAQIRKGASAPAPAVLLQIYGRRPSALGHVVQAASRHSPWVRLEILISALAVPGTSALDVQRIHRELAAWSADMRVRCFVSPSEQQRAVVARLWAGARDNLTMDLQQRLLPHLQAFGVLAA